MENPNNYSSDEVFIDDMLMEVAYLEAVSDESDDEDFFFRLMTILVCSYQVALNLHVQILMHPVLSYPP